MVSVEPRVLAARFGAKIPAFLCCQIDPAESSSEGGCELRNWFHTV